MRIMGDETCFSLSNDELGPAAIGDDGRHTRGQSFQYYISEGVGSGGECKDVHIGVGGRESLTAQNTGKYSVAKVALEPCLFGALSNDQKPEIAEAGVDQSLLQFRKVVNVLFDGQSPHISDYEVMITSHPARRIEQRCVHSAIDRITRLARAFFN